MSTILPSHFDEVLYSAHIATVVYIEPSRRV